MTKWVCLFVCKEMTVAENATNKFTTKGSRKRSCQTKRPRMFLGPLIMKQWSPVLHKLARLKAISSKGPLADVTFNLAFTRNSRTRSRRPSEIVESPVLVRWRSQDLLLSMDRKSLRSFCTIDNLTNPLNSRRQSGTSQLPQKTKIQHFCV